MFTTLKSAVIAGFLGLSTLAAIPAQADSLYLGLGDRHNETRLGIHIGPSGRYNEREYRKTQRSCTPARALEKAQRIGIRRARIDYVNRRTIGVVGRSHGDQVRVTFARAPRCPVIG